MSRPYVTQDLADTPTNEGGLSGEHANKQSFRSALEVMITDACLKLFMKWPTLLVVALCERLRHKKQSGDPQSILIVRIDGLGDCVLTLPLLTQIRHCFPWAKVTVITHPAAAALFEQSALVDRVWVMQTPTIAWLPKQALTLFAALRLYAKSMRRERFDLAIQPRWDSDMVMGTMLCALSRAPMTVGYEDATTEQKQKWNGGFQKAWTTVLPAGPLQHEVLRNLAIGSALGCELVGLEPEVLISHAQREEALRWIGCPDGETLIAVGLPAGDPKRRWSASCYIRLLHRLEAEGPVTPVVFADEATLPVAMQLQHEFPDARLAINQPLLQAAAVMSQCSVFVGSDSGLGHLAAAAGCPTVTLSAHPLAGAPGHPNDPVRFRPYSSKSVVVQPLVGRPGCAGGCTAREPHCILDISEDEVAQTVMEALRRRYPGHGKAVGVARSSPTRVKEEA